MTPELTLELPIPPKAKERARVFTDSNSGRVRAATPSGTHAYQRQVGYLAKAALKRQGVEAPITGAIKLQITINLEPPASWGTRTRNEAIQGSIAPTKRPDIDNYVKAIMDALNQILYQDDAQVVHLTVIKVYGKPSILIKAKQTDQRAAP